MTCLEAQSKIIAYIDYSLDKDDRKEFLNHINRCADCKEELNIYYTMIEGMRQMDNNLPLSVDLTKQLDNRIYRELKSSRQRKDFFRSSILIVMIGVLGFAILAYVNFLNILHMDEQNRMKENQGEYYFSEFFDERLFVPSEETKVISINLDESVQQDSFYDKVKQHNMLKK